MGPNGYSRILAGIDGSPEAEHALAHAITLAKATSATLIIAHVVDMGWLPVAEELAIHVEQVSRARRSHGEALLAAAVAVAHRGGVEAQSSLIETGTPLRHAAEALVDEAASWRPDVIVLGARGSGGMGRPLLGSVADAVARRSAIPVLLVH